MNKAISCDLLVIGAGLAGMAAGARAAVKGLDVIVAGNPSCLSFASGIMDYLGVYPPGGKTILENPEQGVERLVQDFPRHPYALVKPDKILDSFGFFQDQLSREGLAYKRISTADQMKNTVVATAMGTLRPGFMVPDSMAAGARALETGAAEMTLLVAGIKGLAGFSPVQAAQGLASRFARTIPLTLELPGIRTGVPPQVLAGRLEDPRVRKRLVSRLLAHAPKADIIGLPAVCGIGDSSGILSGLSARINRPVFEIPGAPPSIPGLRLKNAFEKILVRTGARLLSNVRICDPVFDGKQFTLTAEFDPWPLKIKSRAVILATGRFFGGGLHARRERIVEPVFHLDVVQPKGRRLWHDHRFLTPRGHAINRAGIETDARFRPLDERGRPVYDHLYAAGAILAHNDWVRMKSGAGTALVSACTAVDAFIEAEGGGHGSVSV